MASRASPPPSHRRHPFRVSLFPEPEKHNQPFNRTFLFLFIYVGTLLTAESYFEGVLFYFFGFFYFNIFPAELFINKIGFSGLSIDHPSYMKHVNYAALFIFTDE